MNGVGPSLPENLDISKSKTFEDRPHHDTVDTVDTVDMDDDMEDMDDDMDDMDDMECLWRLLSLSYVSIKNQSIK